MESPHYPTPRLSDFSPPKQRVRLIDPTSDDVVRHSLERLQSLLIRESNVEEKLEEIEATAGEYRMQQKTLKDKIFLYRAVLAPVRKLSTEVLIMIFGYMLQSSPDDIVHLSLVCTQWRNATLSSTLWSHILVSRECHAVEQKVVLFGARSKPHLLNVSYSQSIDADRRWFAWEKLLLTAPRWATVALTFDDCRSAFLSIPDLGSSPFLQELLVTIRRQSLRSIDEGKYGFDLYDTTKTPSLRALTLSTHILPRTCPWFTKLTKLHITDTFADLVNPWNSIEPMHGRQVLDVLRACPNLEDFSFEAENSSHWFISTKATMDILGWPVQLPNLRRLRLECHYTVGYCLLQYICATENLESVTLRLLPRFQSLAQLKLASVARNFLNSCPRIYSLSLYGLNYRAIMVALKDGLKELQELHLKYVSGLGDASELNDIAWGLLQDATKPDDDSWLVPRLSTIIIDANWNDVPFDRLALAVKMRYTGNIRHGNPSRIQTLVVNDQNLLDGASPGELVAYKRPQRFYSG